MEYLHLTIAYTDFVEKYNDYEDQLKALQKESSTDIMDFKARYQTLNNEIFSFLNTSFNIQNNKFALEFRNTNANQFNIGTKPLTVDDIKAHINAKIREIEYQLKLLVVSDVIISPSDELYQRRQRFTISQKREFILLTLSKLNPDHYHLVELLYLVTGLKKEKNLEPQTLAEQLVSLGYVETNGLAGGHVAIQISLTGIEYIQDLQQEAYGIYYVGEELTEPERENLQDILNELRDLKSDIKEQFKGQEEFSTIALNALYEVIQESLELTNSKLPKKTIKEAIIGKIVSKAGDKGLDTVMGGIWGMFIAKLSQYPEFSDVISNAVKIIGK